MKNIRLGFALLGLLFAIGACATEAPVAEKAAPQSDYTNLPYTYSPAPVVEEPAPEIVEPPAPKPAVKKPAATTTTRRTTATTKKKTTSTSTSNCDPNYKGACLKPNVEDYDCAGGSGNGPYYANGPFQSVGSDPYDLDRDGDGIACE